MHTHTHACTRTHTHACTHSQLQTIIVESEVGIIDSNCFLNLLLSHHLTYQLPLEEEEGQGQGGGGGGRRGGGDRGGGNMSYMDIGCEDIQALSQLIRPSGCTHLKRLEIGDKRPRLCGVDDENTSPSN